MRERVWFIGVWSTSASKEIADKCKYKKKNPLHNGSLVQLENLITGKTLLSELESTWITLQNSFHVKKNSESAIHPGSVVNSKLITASLDVSVCKTLYQVSCFLALYWK